MDLKEKIEMEKDMYFSYLMLNSRAALIEAAYEITVKNAIYDKLLNDFDKLPEEFKKQAELIEGIADYIYLRYKKVIEIIDEKITSFSWTKIIKDFS